MLPSLIKIPRNKRFNYKPRMYDEVKEDLKNRYGSQLRGANGEPLHDQRPFSERLNESYANTRRETTTVSMRRALIFVALAVILLVYILI